MNERFIEILRLQSRFYDGLDEFVFESSQTDDVLIDKYKTVFTYFFYFYLLIFIVLTCFLVHLQNTKNERPLASAGLQCAHIFIDLVELPLPVGVVKKLSVIETVVIRRVGDRM